MSDAERATAVPDPMPTPMSARMRAGASFTPSPVIATTWPCEGEEVAATREQSDHTVNKSVVSMVSMAGGLGIGSHILDFMTPEKHTIILEERAS